MTENIPAIQVEDLSHFYKKHCALNKLSFTVNQKSINGFVGPNGAGKTTTLKILATLLKPQTGTVKILGMDVKTQYKEIRKKIGFMPDHFSMYRKMTVFEYLDFFAAAYGLNLKQRNQTIDDVLTLTDMKKRSNSFIKGLSRGMQQRVSLARVLVNDPDILFLDEPASGLDPRARIELMEILQELKNMGKTIFISSHILSELGDLCDSFTIIDCGETKYTGKHDQLLEKQEEFCKYLLKIVKPKQEFVDALSKNDGIISLSLNEEQGTYCIKFNEDIISVNKLLQAIIATEEKVVSFKPDTRGLKQVFMELTTPGVR